MKEIPADEFMFEVSRYLASVLDRRNARFFSRRGAKARLLSRAKRPIPVHFPSRINA